jgi:glycosyltransferase involved in cell wall biosynthesis
VAGEAALLVDPTDVSAIADGLRRLAMDLKLRDVLIHAGIARAKEFTWEKSVEATWSVYRELLG